MMLIIAATVLLAACGDKDPDDDEADCTAYEGSKSDLIAIQASFCYQDWPVDPVNTPWYVNYDSFTDTGSGLGVDTTTLESEIDVALGYWVHSDAYLRMYQYASPVSWGVSDSDDKNTLEYIPVDTSGEIDSANAIAWALPIGDSSNYVADCDIAILGEKPSGVSITWHFGTSALSSGETSVQTVLAHEYGHCLGLHHLSSDGTDTYEKLRGKSVMSDVPAAGYYDLSSIFAIDNNAAIYVYGTE